MDFIEEWNDKVETIAKNDPEYLDTDSLAIIATSMATKFFIESLTYESIQSSLLRKKPNTIITNEDTDETDLVYDDIANVISVNDKFSFLNDMVPKTKKLRDLVSANKVRYTTLQGNFNALNKSKNKKNSNLSYIDTTTTNNDNNKSNNNNNNQIIQIDIDNDTEDE